MLHAHRGAASHRSVARPTPKFAFNHNRTGAIKTNLCTCVTGSHRRKYVFLVKRTNNNTTISVRLLFYFYFRIDFHTKPNDQQPSLQSQAKRTTLTHSKRSVHDSSPNQCLILSAVCLSLSSFPHSLSCYPQLSLSRSRSAAVAASVCSAAREIVYALGLNIAE